MIPVRDTVPCLHTPVLTWTLMVLNASIFLLLLAPPAQVVQNIFYLYGLIPARFTHPDWALQVGLPVHDYWPFLTNMFLHAGWLHIILNMWMLWIFGDNIEDRMGTWRFISFYLLCGVVAGIVHMVFNSDSPIPVVGASGAIAGILGAYFFLFPYARLVIWIPILFLPIFVEVPAIAFLGVWVIFQLYSATTATDLSQGYTDVAWWGHLGGFIAGVVSYRFFLRPEER
jgi:rhomboid family protein